MGNVPASSPYSAEFSEPSKRVGIRASDNFVLADLYPGMGSQLAPIAGNAKANPTRDAAPAQHGVRGERTRQTKNIHRGSRTNALDCP
jgi:hypothetical protein